MILTCGTLQACYPIYKTIRTPVKVIVVDEQGQALQDAQVVMHTTKRPGFMDMYTSLDTDHSGKAKFKRYREMKVETLFLHGVEYYRWSLCISKKGYEKVKMIELERNKINKQEVVILKKDHSSQGDQVCADQ